MQIKVVHYLLPLLGQYEGRERSACCFSLWSPALYLSMLISANVLPISPECWRNATKLRTIKLPHYS
ncbi:hypothetical protein FHO86_00295 [Escherichia coli]|nr:hypothetical protein [Escherichia coli]EFV9523412.1 hypothetical protein [Shigella sonnei]EFB2858469.1 hypothetical protein [Escherichia coli]EFD0562390.1 hypothetical protein [Escherichia coli]EFI8243429.1 hypothetical protein [Escherichia coli]